MNDWTWALRKWPTLNIICYWNKWICYSFYAALFRRDVQIFSKYWFKNNTSYCLTMSLWSLFLCPVWAEIQIFTIQHLPGHSLLAFLPPPCKDITSLHLYQLYQNAVAYSVSGRFPILSESRLQCTSNCSLKEYIAPVAVIYSFDILKHTLGIPAEFQQSFSEVYTCT